MGKDSKKELILIFLRGMLMGFADIIPGVSGGTIALITGIYERLTKSISNLKPDLLFPLLNRDFKKFQKKLKGADIFFLAVLIFGIATSFILMSNILSYLLSDYGSLAYSFFFGLIISSAAIIYLRTDGINPKNIFFLLAGAILSYFIVGFAHLSLDHSLPVLFFSGTLALCAMILPGISGAFLLLILNQYEYLLYALKSLNLVEISTFLLGGILGLLAFSRILNALLSKYKSIVLSFLIGLMLGSLRILYLEISFVQINFLDAFTAFLIGIIVPIFLEIKTRKLEITKVLL